MLEKIFCKRYLLLKEDSKSYWNGVMKHGHEVMIFFCVFPLTLLVYVNKQNNQLSSSNHNEQQHGHKMQENGKAAHWKSFLMPHHLKLCKSSKINMHMKKQKYIL